MRKAKDKETIDQALQRLGPVINLAKVLRLTELPYQTIYSKIKRKTPFSEAESKEVLRVLRQHGCA